MQAAFYVKQGPARELPANEVFKSLLLIASEIVSQVTAPGKETFACRA
jgi:hypothetical protein